MQAFVQNRFEQIKTEREKRYTKIASEVKNRLCRAINYWDAKANEYEEKANHGVKNATLNANQARDKADELRSRQNARLREIELEKQVHPQMPRIIGCAFVISRAQLESLKHPEIDQSDKIRDTKPMEMAGMNAVMEIERELGHTPIDVSANNVGYDIESHANANDSESSHILRLIEVKARKADADFITMTRNEILTARNCEERGNYILAIVLVDGDHREVTYYENLHFKDPDVSMRSINYNIRDLELMGTMRLITQHAP